MYCIYYLPNAVRKYKDGTIVQGKVGCTMYFKKRVIYGKSYTTSYGKLDITNYTILHDCVIDKNEAKSIELHYQKIFNCIDEGNRPKTDDHKQKIGNSQRGVKRGPQTAEHRAKNSAGNKGKPKPKTECPYCNVMIANNMLQRHMAVCKQKPKAD